MEMNLNPQEVELYRICRDPAYVSLHPNQKQPIGKDWRNNSIPPERAVENNKTLKHNIGILTGTHSGLVDVDLDCAEATKFAPLFLPPAVASFGHAGNNRGHHLVRVSNPTAKTQQFLCPDSRETLVELRADGSQTMIPPSVHPNGHKLKFHQINDTATVAEYNVVLDAVQKNSSL
jgi:putative DNA primase/helicase